MAKLQYSSVFEHSSDATFRAWGSELSAKLQAAGLVKTTDTGQIDWATVARPTTNTAAGYEMYRFNDALQATAPVFIKIEYGTGGSATTPITWIDAGTGTDGAGTLTGLGLTRATLNQSGIPVGGGSTPYNTQISHKNGFLGVSFKNGASADSSGAAHSAFFIGRSCDPVTGAENGNGLYIARTSSTPNQFHWQFVDFVNATVTTAGATGCLVAGNVTGSLVSGSPQLYRNFGGFPRMIPLLHIVTVISAEIPAGSVFSEAIVGTTPRTYLSLGSYIKGASANGNVAHGLAMLWEA